MQAPSRGRLFFYVAGPWAQRAGSLLRGVRRRLIDRDLAGVASTLEARHVTGEGAPQVGTGLCHLLRRERPADLQVQLDSHERVRGGLLGEVVTHGSELLREVDQDAHADLGPPPHEGDGLVGRVRGQLGVGGVAGGDASEDLPEQAVIARSAERQLEHGLMLFGHALQLADLDVAHGVEERVADAGEALAPGVLPHAVGDGAEVGGLVAAREQVGVLLRGEHHVPGRPVLDPLLCSLAEVQEPVGRSQVVEGQVGVDRDRADDPAVALRLDLHEVQGGSGSLSIGGFVNLRGHEAPPGEMALSVAPIGMLRHKLDSALISVLMKYDSAG